LGDGVLRDDAVAAARADDTIVFHGPRALPEVYEAIRACAAVVVPSVGNEGLPRTVVESLAHGRPLVASNVGGLAEVLDDRVAWMSPMTVDGLTTALVRAHQEGSASRCAAARRRYE